MAFGVAEPPAFAMLRISPTAARSLGMALRIAEPAAFAMFGPLPSATRRLGVALRIAEPAAVSSTAAAVATFILVVLAAHRATPAAVTAFVLFLVPAARAAAFAHASAGFLSSGRKRPCSSRSGMLEYLGISLSLRPCRRLASASC